MGMPDPENISIAVEITLQSGMGAEIRWGPLDQGLYITQARKQASAPPIALPP